MEVGYRGSKNMAGIMEGELDIRGNVGYAAVIQGDRMADIGLDLV